MGATCGTRCWRPPHKSDTRCRATGSKPLAKLVSLSNQYLADDIVRATVKVIDGHAEVPAGAGLGVEVDEAKVRKYTRTV